ncbi:MAG: hypothetical protein HY746_10870 [Elusimicrobia bacterium]|nr:hypothetical protein [Elusimicrobiota bacterium]
MAKPKLKTTAAAATETWVKGNRTVTHGAAGKKVSLMVYLSPKVHKLLWIRRVETGIPVTRTIEDAVSKFFKEG